MVDITLDLDHVHISFSNCLLIKIKWVR